jgi:hypothetical protein
MRIFLASNLALFVVACIVLGEEGPAPTTPAEGGRSPTLPFAFRVTEEPYADQDRPDFMSSRNPSDGMDFPFSPVVIDGEFWVFSKNGYQGPRVYRYKGTTIENAVRQPDGDAAELQQGMYILGGIWYDAADKKLYAPLHTEFRDLNPTTYREIHLATSTDKGLTWKYEGPIIADTPPGAPRKSSKDFQGKLYSGGSGDHLIYGDERNGFVYVFTDHYTWGGGKFVRHCVARCAIADKLAPGKWRKFYNGGWDEPALGGKASYVNGYCVTYNTYLKKYLSFNYLSGISMCSDLAKQDWTPSFHVGGQFWGVDGLFAMWPTNAAKNDVTQSGQTFYVYGSWWTAGKRFRVELQPGETRPDFGFTHPTMWFAGQENQPHPVKTMDPGQFYDLDSFPESWDPIETRQTRHVGCVDPALTYSGRWTDPAALPAGPPEFHGQAKTTAESGASVEVAFRGKGVFWRALKGPDQGKADVFLDGILQCTVDCSATEPVIYQFAFMRRGLTDGPHSIKIVAKGERGQLSSSANLTHLEFEVEP